MPAVAPEVAAYLAEVRTALADLPPQARDELLEDLPEHLAEVAAEGGGSLVERLGPPAAYAAELRQTAGLGGVSAPATETTRERMAAVSVEARRRLRQADVKVGPMLGYATASDFLRLLVPAWWVLRGYLAAMLFAYLLDNSGQRLGLLPRLGGSGLVALLVLAAFVLGSIWLGRRQSRLRQWPRRGVATGTALVVLFAVVGFVNADSVTRWQGDLSPDDIAPVYENPAPPFDDIFVYDEQGRLLKNVRLFDQDGWPISVGSEFCADGSPVGTGGTPAVGPDGTLQGPRNAYPRCPGQAPYTFGGSPGPAGATPSAGPPATPTPSPPSPSPTPS